MTEKRVRLFARRHLDARFERAMRRPITVVESPGGSGKTCALGTYLENRGEPHLRIHLGSRTKTVRDFVRVLASALAEFQPGDGDAAAGPDLESADGHPHESIAVWLRERFDGRRVTLFVDDVPGRDGGPVIDLLAKVIDETCGDLRWIVAGADLSGLPVAFWLAHSLADLPIGANDLRFRLDEAQALARARRSRLDDSAVAAAVDRFNGMPLATAWAIDVCSGTDDLYALPAGPQAALEALAERSLRGRNEQEVALLERVAMLPDLEPRLLDAVNEERVADAVAALFAEVPCAFASIAPARLRTPVCALLERRLAARGEATAQAAFRRAAAALSKIDRVAEAVLLLVRVKDAESLAGVLATHGFGLVDAGRLDVLAEALPLFDTSRESLDPKILALEATLESSRDRFDTAEAWFRMAIHRSSDEAKADIAHRFAIDAMRSGRTDVVESLMAMSTSNEAAPSAGSLALRATLATAYASDERHADARRWIDDVLARLHDGIPPKVQARIYQQAAFVAMRADDHARAREHAAVAMQRAAACGSYAVAALATTVLYELAQEVDDDPVAVARYVDELARYSTLSGDRRFRLYALLAAFTSAVERADHDAIRDLERALQRRDLLQHTQFINEALVVDQAMRAAWRGEFERAYRFIAHNAGDESGGRRVMRLAEIALYAAASGYAAESRQAADEALKSFADIVPLSRAGRTPALLALAATLVGDEARADGALALAISSGTTGNARNAALCVAVEAVRAYFDGVADLSTFRETLERLDACGLGGYHLFIAALPSQIIAPLHS